MSVCILCVFVCTQDTEVILWYFTLFPLQKIRALMDQRKDNKKVLLFQTHTTSALKGEALCPMKPFSLKYWGLESLKGEGLGIREYEIWPVLVRQFALGMLSTALIPSSAPLWDVVYPRPVNTPTPFPGGEPF